MPWTVEEPDADTWPIESAGTGSHAVYETWACGFSLSDRRGATLTSDRVSRQ